MNESTAEVSTSNVETATTNVAKAEKPKPKVPDNVGHQFASLRHKEKTIETREREVKQYEDRVRQGLQQVQELESLSTDQLLERIATKKGQSPEDYIREYIAKKVGAPSADKTIEDSQDPAVRALAEQIKAQAKDNEELRKALKTRDDAEKAAKDNANVTAVQGECLASASSVFTEDSDYPMFFESKEDLASQVFQFCRDRVAWYQKTYNDVPAEDDLVELIKAAPQALLDAHLKTPRGQRILSLKAPPQATQSRKPRLSANAMTEVKSPSTSQPTTVRTKIDHQARLEEAKRRLPGNVRFPGQ
jgi:uncharacterized protein (DUF305 family)